MQQFINKLFVSECNDFMQFLDGNVIDLTVTSPPYDNLRKYNGFTFNFEKTAKNLFRITKSGGVLVWVVGDQTIKGSETGTSFKQALYFMSLGFKLHDTMIYAKMNFIPQTHNRYEQEFEYMFVFVKDKLKTFNPLLIKTKTFGTIYKLNRRGYENVKEGSMRRREENYLQGEFKRHGNIFYYPCGVSGKNHPAVFPKQLATDSIKSWSNSGDLIFDPFSGSGTTCEEAAKLNRNWLGCDISKQYITDSQERLNKVRTEYDSL